VVFDCDAWEPYCAIKTHNICPKSFQVSNKIIARKKGNNMSQFKPNALTFDQGVQRVEAANFKAGFKFKSKITTSKDKGAIAATEALLVSNVPGGFKKFQLPVLIDGPSQIFVSVGAPDAKVPSHSHDEGDGLRYIVSGSIIYEGKELTAGDWMYIPKGKKYSLQIGPKGATMFYCYRCCCA
jgi:quercetin dioxygenase-like cupin family protein